MLVRHPTSRPGEDSWDPANDRARPAVPGRRRRGGLPVRRRGGRPPLDRLLQAADRVQPGRHGGDDRPIAGRVRRPPRADLRVSRRLLRRHRRTNRRRAIAGRRHLPVRGVPAVGGRGRPGSRGRCPRCAPAHRPRPVRGGRLAQAVGAVGEGRRRRQAGTGRQYMPWISLVDEVRAIAFVLEHEVVRSGQPHRAGACHQCRVHQGARQACCTGRPSSSCRASRRRSRWASSPRTCSPVSARCPSRLTEAGFTFRHSDVRAALAAELGGR